MSTKIERILAHGVYLETYRDQVIASYRKARQMGADDPAVLLLDPEDDTARAIAEESGQAAAIDEQREAGKQNGMRLTLTWGIPRALAAEYVADHLSELAEILAVASTDDRRFPVVIVAGGSASLLYAVKPDVAS
jgi:hypothetical protein